MAQAVQVGYSVSEDRMMESEQEEEMDGVDPWKAAMQVCAALASDTTTDVGACVRGLGEMV